MNKKILVAGATGDLGLRIVKALLSKQADVIALVRNDSNSNKINDLRHLGVKVIKADMNNVDEIASASRDVSCVVSAVSGLRDVIVDAQLNLLKGAIKGGVKRIIPSDFATDFLTIPEGVNRNYDLRKEFKKHLDSSTIKATSIFNGAFAEVLGYNIPLFDKKGKTIAFFEGKKDWKIDFTTMDDTAMYTAFAALDDETPRYLRISSFSVSPEELVQLGEKYRREKFDLVNKGTLEDLSAKIKVIKAADPEADTSLYSKTQKVQYLYSMFFAHNETSDNSRYPIEWTSIENYLKNNQSD